MKAHFVVAIIIAVVVILMSSCTKHEDVGREDDDGPIIMKETFKDTTRFSQNPNTIIINKADTLHLASGSKE